MSAIPPKQTVTGTDSVRMNTSSGLPPTGNATPDPVPVNAQPEFSATSALVTMHDAASQSGSDAFPVLKAFQDYLESERQRARQRTVILSGIFAVVILVVIAGFMAIWFSTMRDMRETNARLLQAAISGKSQTEAAQQQTPPRPSSATSAEETAKLVADAVAKAQSEQSALYAKTLESLNASLSEVQKANAEMKAELDNRKAAEKAEEEKAAQIAAEKAAKEEAAKLAQEKSAQAKAAAEAQAQAAAEPQELVIPKFAAPPPVEGYTQSAMGIRLPKEPAPLSWRIYLPEH